MSLSPGTRLGAYEIVSRLGAGGMGEVYRARHVKLERDVAVKVLPDEVASDPDRLRRFEREARAASSLNHPNIVTIHDIDERDGTPFIAMELVEGKTLRQRLGEGRVSTSELVALATQIAEGLAKAHAAGIIHRDLKPENLMVTDDGLVKILDFGLAKLSPRSETGVSELTTVEQATRAGLLLGTVPYMSPEQAAGRPVDHRSDQFSFGSILYEMAIGAHPFRRATAAQTLAAIIEDEPDGADRLEARLPTALVAIVHRCLAKNPTGRFDSTSDLAESLKRVPDSAPLVRPGPSRRAIVVGTSVVLVAFLVLALVAGLDRAWEERAPSAAAPLVESLAVLPLRNLSGDTEQEYLADGMTEALITDLAKIGALRVIARTSAMRYKGSDKALGDIGSELKVDAVIEGSFLRVGDRVRVTAQLVDVGTQQALWSESYERDFANLLSLQGEVARAVARQIEVTVAPDEAGRLAGARTVNLEAYEAVLKGRFHSYKLTPVDLDTAVSYFELALEKDPRYAPAYVGVANVWGGRAQMGYLPPHEAVPRMKAAVLKALELDETLSEAHHSLAALQAWGEWDWPSAEREFQRALELNPNNPDALRSHSHFLNIVGRPEEALRQIERALDLDPFNAMSIAFHGVDLLFVRRYEEAVARFRDALRTSPGLPFANQGLSLALHVQGRHEEALAASRSFLVTVGDREGQEALTHGYEEGGYRGAMLRLAEVFAARSLKTRTRGYQVAVMYLRAGENERALEWLERSYENHDPGMPYLGLPQFDPVRDDPRFQDLLRRLNLPAAPRGGRTSGTRGPPARLPGAGAHAAGRSGWARLAATSRGPGQRVGKAATPAAASTRPTPRAVAAEGPARPAAAAMTTIPRSWLRPWRRDGSGGCRNRGPVVRPST